MASDRLRSVNKDDGEAVEMDMSPMIDMVFLLLLFFLVVSNPKTIKIDPNLTPSVAENAQAAKTKNGKIVVNVRKNGDVIQEDTKTQLNGMDDLQDYIKKEKERVQGKGYEPVLHIRADQGVEFKYVQRVIKSGAAVGVKQVAYASFNKE
ncbi:MAG: biopolymer transport protein ExbD [Akkermansiaceae bacterium]|jgi:biopolymer transport protein ExbD